MDGRDIGTVICPDAEAKLFVTASVEIRAERRFNELSANGQTTDYETVLADVKERDRRDSERATAPLKPADDAIVIDTSELDIEAAITAAIDAISAIRGAQ